MKTELPRTITRCKSDVYKRKKETKETNQRWYQKTNKKKRKTRDSEYQTLKSRGKGCK